VNVNKGTNRLSQKIEKVGNAYRFKTKSEDYVYIGDPELPEFRPVLKLNRWGGECFLKLRFGDRQIKEKSCRLEENKVKWETKDFSFHFYPLKPKTVVIKHPQTGEVLVPVQNELGGLELEIILKKKPIINQVSFNIESQGLKFYYQPPLHPEHSTWIDTNGDGIANRLCPQNVVGSYAVYHATKTNLHRGKKDAEKYKAGKAFHIYRPLATDSAGNQTWCNLHISETKGKLTITIPQEFLDKAFYPVNIDPTFGYTTLGLQYDTLNLGSSEDAFITGQCDTCPETGVAESITVGLFQTLVLETWDIKCALYKVDTVPFGDSLEDMSYHSETEERIGMGVAGTPTWYTFNYIVGASISNIDYWIVVWAGNPSYGGYKLYIAGDIVTVPPYQGYKEGPITYNAFPATLLATGMGMAYSIYCTYTPVVVPRIVLDGLTWIT